MYLICALHVHTDISPWRVHTETAKVMEDMKEGGSPQLEETEGKLQLSSVQHNSESDLYRMLGKRLQTLQ